MYQLTTNTFKKLRLKRPILHPSTQAPGQVPMCRANLVWIYIVKHERKCFIADEWGDIVLGKFFDAFDMIGYVALYITL